MKRSTFLSIPFIIIVILMNTACGPGGKQHQEDANRQDRTTEENWIQLFNGTDLDDWVVKFKGYPSGENYKNTFRVEDGLLRVTFDEWDKWNDEFGHLFYKDSFSHYRLRAEYRFVGNQVEGGPGWAFRNNGLMLHGQTAETMELNQDFPVSVEVQLLGGNGKDERSTLNVCTPGTNIVMDDQLIEDHCISSSSRTFHGDQWVTVEVEVRGNEIISHIVDGKEVLQYSNPQLDPRDRYYEKLLSANGDIQISSGTISIQAESHPTDFRKIELLVLDENNE